MEPKTAYVLWLMGCMTDAEYVREIRDYANSHPEWKAKMEGGN